MSDTKISALPAATAALGADELPINEAGASKKLTVAQIAAYALAGARITALTAASAALGTDELPINEAGAAKKVTVAQIQTLIMAGAQPLDSDLTAIAALTTTTYGRALLTLANVAALTALLATTGDTAWTDVTFQNGWSNFAGGFEACSFRKDALGFVHLKGMMAAGTVGANCFQLPAGYRTGGIQMFSVISNGAIGRLDFASTGAVNVTAGNNTYISLAGISFFAQG